MNTEKFNTQEDMFHVLDLRARFNFKAASSISFSLERSSKSLCPTRQMGWIDVHHPCNAHIKLQIRISLPSEYHTAERLRQIVAAVLAATGVPPTETYEALLFAHSGAIAMVQPVDHEGMTDRLFAEQAGCSEPRDCVSVPMQASVARGR